MKYQIYGSINHSRSELKTQTPKKNICTCKKYFINFMTIFGFLSLIFFLITLIVYLTCTNLQSRLSYNINSNTSDLTVTWSTLLNYENNSLILNTKNTKNEYIANTKKYITNWPFSRYTHRVELKNLTKYKNYNYTINSGNYIQESNFLIKDKKNMTNVIVFGDMGVFNDYTLSYLKNHIDTNKYDYILHLGDIAYSLESYFGIVGDIFLSEIQPIASKIPYMVLPGNHESYDNFSNYKNRFSMPNYKKTNNLFYSINTPPLKVITINTEVFYYKNIRKTFKSQLNYLENELIQTNRTTYPWLIVAGHRPMYCSNDNNDDCTHWQTNVVRLYLEKSLKKHNVSIYLSAHEHSYERICPIFNGTCQSNYQSIKHNYYNITYPIHLISGCAGNIEGTTEFKSSVSNWSLFRDINKGYGTLSVSNNMIKWKSYKVKNNKKYLIDNFNIYS